MSELVLFAENGLPCLSWLIYSCTLDKKKKKLKKSINSNPSLSIQRTKKTLNLSVFCARQSAMV